MITQEMLNKLNTELKINGYNFKFEFMDSLKGVAEVKLSNTKGLYHCQLYLDKGFLDWLISWFKDRYDIDITYNSSQTAFYNV